MWLKRVYIVPVLVQVCFDEVQIGLASFPSYEVQDTCGCALTRPCVWANSLALDRHRPCVLNRIVFPV